MKVYEVPISSREEQTSDPLFAATGLTAGYGSTWVVKDVSVQTRAGHVVTIVGPNGAGKSTLLKVITGVLRPAEGKVTLDGEEVTGFPSEVLARKGVGYVPQVGDVFDTMTVSENLEMGGYLLGKDELSAQIEGVLHLIPQLRDLYRRRAKTLSGGERKLLAVGRALMLNACLLILDEPTAGLSPAMSRAIVGNLRGLADSGTAILIVEQKVHEALEISDHGYVLVAGKVVLDATAKSIAARDDLGDIFLGTHRP